MLSAAILAFSFINFLRGLVMVVFILSALLMVVIVLLQEPKGGGLASAFGGMGGETFGVQTGGVNKFTSWVAAVFMTCAFLYAAVKPEAQARAPSDRIPTAPAETPGEGSEGTGDEGVGDEEPADAVREPDPGDPNAPGGG